MKKWGLSLLFLFSGITSLIYETIWIRTLSLGVGSTAAALSLVLSIFFMGLGLGSYLAGRFHHFISKPLLFYGTLEAFIGLYAFLIYKPLIGFQSILAYLPLSGSFSIIGTTFKFILVFLLLVLPSTAMGATLPLLVRVFVENEISLNKSLSWLYALNTLGGVLGTFATSFILIPYFGLTKTNWITALLNLFIFIVTVFISRRDHHIPLDISKSRASLNLNKKDWIILISCGVCGFSSLTTEVVWSKFLSIYFGTNIYGLGLVLAVFLVGIAGGSFFLSFISDKIKNREQTFLFLFIMSALFILISSLLLNWTPLGALVVSYYLGGNLLFFKSILVCIVLFSPTLMFGILLPMSLSLVSGKDRDGARVVGIGYAINTIGSIVGSFLAGMILIPIVGSSKTIFISITALLLMALLLLRVLNIEKIKRVVIIFISLSILLVSFLVESIDYKNVIRTAYVQFLPKNSTWAQIKQYFSTEYEEFLKIFEGKTAVISLSHDQQDGSSYRDYIRLKTNGLNESIYSLVAPQIFPRFEALLGLLPYTVHPNPQSAFIVGYGGGYSVDFLSSLPLKKVYVAELEEGIIEAASFVTKGNNPILKRKNLHLEIEDARFVMASRLHGPFDLILSQPSHSWLSGVANLFTKDFFEIVKLNLTSNGIFSQWLNLYRINDTILKSILKTFFTVFPYGAVFTDKNDSELIMLGSMKPIEFQKDKIEKIISDQNMKYRLSFIPVESAEDVLSIFSLNRTEVLSLTENSLLNTDENAYAETSQSRLFYQDTEKTVPQQFFLDHYKGGLEEIISLKGESSNSAYFKLLQTLLKKGKYDKFYSLFKKFEQNSDISLQNHQQIGSLCYEAQRIHCTFDRFQKMMDQTPSKEALLYLLGASIDLGRSDLVPALTQKFHSYQSYGSDCYLGWAFLKLGRFEKNPSLFQKISQDFSKYYDACGPFFEKLNGMIFFAKGDLKESQKWLEIYYKKYPKDFDVLEKLIGIFSIHQQKKNLIKFIDYYQESLSHYVENLRLLSELYRKLGFIQDAEALDRIIYQYEIRDVKN